MSWNLYIDSVINYSKDANKAPHVDFVAIVGLNGALCTTNEHASHFGLSAEECMNISNAFQKNNTDELKEKGIVAKGVKYMFLSDEKNNDELIFIHGKKKEQGSISICKCPTCFIVAHSAEGMQAGNANKAIDDTRKYLAEQNATS